MKAIERLMPVFIYVDDDDPLKCDAECPWCYDNWECRRYSGMEKGSMIRGPGCIEDFGTGDSE